VTAATYRLRFWGVRGTVPTADIEKLRFGGNTPCAAVDLGGGDYLVLDCGSGLRLFGSAVSSGEPGPKRYHILLSHYHLDHVEGLPFFQPLYDPQSAITFYGFESGGKRVKEILETLISPPYFPIRMGGVPSKLDYRTTDGTPLSIGDLRVSTLRLNHPDGSQSYRLEHGDHRIVFATDHEHGDERIDRALVEFSQGVDYLIYDATYQEAEYEKLRRGWGHSTWYAAVQTARAARVGTLVLFHHHPDHTDKDLDKILRIARKELPSTEIAREGMELPF